VNNFSNNNACLIGKYNKEIGKITTTQYYPSGRKKIAVAGDPVFIIYTSLMKY